jgi:hypothetical protein
VARRRPSGLKLTRLTAGHLLQNRFFLGFAGCFAVNRRAAAAFEPPLVASLVRRLTRGQDHQQPPQAIAFAIANLAASK